MSKLNVIPVRCDGCEAIQKPGESGWRRYWATYFSDGRLETLNLDETDPDEESLPLWHQRDACGERCMIVDIHRLLGFAGSPCSGDPEQQESERAA